MGQQLYLYSKLKSQLDVGVAKASLKERQYVVIWIRPETKWSSHERVEIVVKSNGGPNSCVLQNTEMMCD